MRRINRELFPSAAGDAGSTDIKSELEREQEQLSKKFKKRYIIIGEPGSNDAKRRTLVGPDVSDAITSTPPPPCPPEQSNAQSTSSTTTRPVRRGKKR